MDRRGPCPDILVGKQTVNKHVNTDLRFASGKTWKTALGDDSEGGEVPLDLRTKDEELTLMRVGWW